MECPKGPHSCRRRWDCGHGKRLPTHNPDGSYFHWDGGGCQDCKAELDEANARVQSVRRKFIG